jgi:hypothetical protein
MASCDKTIARVKFIAWRGCGNTTELVTQERIQVGWGYRAAAPHPKLKFTKHRFLGMMLLNVLRDLPFSRIKPPKSADE